MLTNDLHDRMQALEVDAVALHHVRASPQVKHANGSLVAPQHGQLSAGLGSPPSRGPKI